MTPSVALVVAEPGTATGELDRALREDGFETRHSSPAELVEHPGLCTAVDMVLASASLGLQQIALLDQKLSDLDSAPTLVVFPQSDLCALETCVRGGFDYVVPPFLPALLHNRLTSCRERNQLTMTVEEMAAAAKLREYERDLSIAREIQSGFLPDTLPTRPGWDFAFRFRPAREVAGDFYDGFELVNGRRLGFVVADVCDKGIGAALFMALIRTLLRHTAQHTGAWNLMDDEPVLAGPGAPVGGLGDGAAGALGGANSLGGAGSPGTVGPVGGVGGPVLAVGAGPLLHAVVGTNHYMARNHLSQGYFATMFFGVLDPLSGALLYINGGHNPPVLVQRDGGQTLLPPTGPAVGILPNSTYTLGHAQLDPGAALLVYTDGVVDARDVHGRLYTTNRLREVVAEAAGSAEELVARVDDSVRRHVGAAEQFDDITMVALRRTGP